MKHITRAAIIYAIIVIMVGLLVGLALMTNPIQHTAVSATLGITATPASPYSDAIQTIRDREATERSQPAEPKKSVVTFTPQLTRPTATPRLGILDITISEFQTNHIATIRNQWAGEENSRIIRVYVGGLWYDPAQGFVGIISRPVGNSVDDPESESSTYLTPIKAGPVEIIDVKGTLLTLRGQNGVTFVFDRTTGQFVNTPPSSYPTATPGITPTPSPIINP